MHCLCYYKQPVDYVDCYPYSYLNCNHEPSILLLDKKDFAINDVSKSMICPEELKTDFSINSFTWKRLDIINQLCEHGHIDAALHLALTIPDICSAIQYGKQINGDKRYPKWFEENIYKYEIGQHGKTHKNFDCLNGFCCYKLRCQILHGNTDDIDMIVNDAKSSMVKDFGYKYVYFRLTNKTYSEMFVVQNEVGEQYAIVLHSARQLIKSILHAAETLYKSTENKSIFQKDSFVIMFPEYKTYIFNKNGGIEKYGTN